MAFMNKDKKKQLAPGIKAVLDKYSLKGSLSVKGHSTLRLTITSGRIDFYGDALNSVVNEPSGRNRENYRTAILKRERLDVNLYWIDSNFDGKSVKVLHELKAAMQVGNHDNSRAEIDYFDVGWYNDIHIGKRDKPYVLVT